MISRKKVIKLSAKNSKQIMLSSLCILFHVSCFLSFCYYVILLGKKYHVRSSNVLVKLFLFILDDNYEGLLLPK